MKEITLHYNVYSEDKQLCLTVITSFSKRAYFYVGETKDVFEASK